MEFVVRILVRAQRERLVADRGGQLRIGKCDLGRGLLTARVPLRVGDRRAGLLEVAAFHQKAGPV